MNTKFGLTPRARIIFVLTLPVILAAGVVAIFLQYRLLNGAIEQWGPDNAFLIHTLENNIDYQIETSVQTLVATSKQPAFSSLPFLDRVDESINGLPEDVDPEKRQVLETLTTDLGLFSVLFLLSPDGNHYISHPYAVQEEIQKFNLADRPYFIEVEQTKQPVISDSFLGADGIPAVAIDVPVLNAENEIIAHLGGVFHLSKLSELVDADVISPFDAGFIVDRKGQLIAHTDVRLLEDDNRMMFVNHPLIQDCGVDTGRTSTERFTDSEGETEYLASMALLDDGWCLVLLRKESSIIESVRSQVFSISLLIFLMFFGIGSIGVWLAARISRKWEGAEDRLRKAHDELEERVTERTRELKQSEQRARSLFENAEVSIWNEDMSEVCKALDRIRLDGVEDLREFLAENEQTVWDLASLVKVVHVNESTLKLFGAKAEEEFLHQIENVFGANAVDVFTDELCAIWEKQESFRAEAEFRTVSGEEFDAIISFHIPETEDGFKSIPVSIIDITERKQMEKTIQESETRYKLLTEMTSDYALSLRVEADNTLIVEWVVGSYVKIIGRAPELGKSPVAQYTHPDDLAMVRRDIARTLQNEPTISEHRKYKPDGTLLWLRVTRRPVWDEMEQRVVRFYSVVQDITERKWAEEALRESENRYRMLFNSGSDAIIVSDLETREIIEVNDAACRNLGYSKEELLELSPTDFSVSEESRNAPFFDPELMEGFLDKKSILFETVHITKSGKRFPVEVSSHIFDFAGQTSVLSVARDITERKQAEQKLRQRNQALEQSPVSVLITDTNGIIEYINPKFSEVTGYTNDESIGQNARLQQSGEHTLEFYQDLWKTIGDGQEWRGEIRNRKKNGDLYWEQASITGVKDHRGEITHYVAVKEDITERKQREEEHVRQERLAAVGQLAAGIAHDFNNVMAVITLYADLMQRATYLSEKDMKRVQTIYKQAMHAADLTQQILDFSRQSAREPQPLDLKLLLNEMLKFVERTIPERIQIKFAFSRGDCTVNVDPTQLQQVITNLTVNARDAMPQGGELYFDLSQLTLLANETRPIAGMTHGEWVKLTVTDTGVGIEPEALSHIFEPFFTTKEVGKGTGLGLAQVYGIVQQHDGYISVDSQVGRGTAFTIYLPALMNETAVKPDDPTTDLPMGDGETILVVEDNQVLLEATQAILESLNYQVLTAADGVAALNLYVTQPDNIDLVLTDVVMPRMDGFDLAKALQQQLRPPKVLFMSGFSGDTVTSAELKQLALGWLQKPLSLAQLAGTLRDIFR